MRSYLHHGAVGLAAALLTLAACRQEARACGGGSFGPVSQTQSSFVSGHRVAISMSPYHTVLWDQIEYSGAPQDFAWVMPVKSGATINVATDAWIEVLDAATQTVVSSPPLDCGSDSGGCNLGCGAGAGNKGGDFGSGSGVTVVHQGTIGPYMTVTLKSGTPGGIAQWLTDNGYNISAEIQPILDDYTAKGMDFIALRLKPDQGVDKMQPVMVTTPGLLTTFPMRMLQAGSGDRVALKVFVISESRVEASGFTNVKIDPSKLIWDFDKSTSNYDAVRVQTLTGGSDRNWITAFSKKELLAPSEGPYAGPVYTVGDHQDSTITQAYFDQAMTNGDIAVTCPGTPPTGIETSTDKVVELCPPGQPCTMLLPNEIDSTVFECAGLKDLSAALIGLHPANVVLTRLEAELPRAALDMDLTLSPAVDQAPVDNMITAKQTKGSPPGDCSVISAVGPGEISSPPPRRRGLVTLALTLAAAALAVGRRVRRQRPLLTPARAG